MLIFRVEKWCNMPRWLVDKTFVNQQDNQQYYWVVAWLFLCLLPFGSRADNYLEMDLEELLAVSVKGSTLRDESLKTVPSSVTVFTRQQLDALGLDYLHELINLVPGFQTTRGADSPVNYTYSARGRRLGVRAREILLVVDGRVFSDPRSSGADSAVSLFPIANIERIEIIRGPGSAIYGSGAFTGVINIVSRRNQQRLAVAAGSDERRKADINISQPLGEVNLDLYAYAAQDKGQDYRLASMMTTDDPRQERLLDLEFSHKDTRVKWFNSKQEGQNFYVLEKVNNDFNAYSNTYNNLQIEQGFKPVDHWDSRLSMGYSKASQLFHGALVSAGNLQTISQPASTEPMLAKVLLAGEVYRASLANDLTLSGTSSLQFGMEWHHERETDARATTNYDLGQLAAQDYPVTFYGNFNQSFKVGTETSRDTSGIYGQLLYHLTDATRLTLGARYDYYQSIGEHVSPRVGLVHQLGENHSLKLLYGEAFRAPSMAETGLINNPVVVGNPDLDNETVKTLEFLWLGNWDSISMAATIYHNRYESPIVGGLIGTTRTYLNDEDASNYGAGVRIDWQASPHWLLRLNYTQMEDLPDSAFREADNLGIVILNFNQGKWNWSLSGSYQGERHYLLTQTQQASLEPHWVANSKLRYQLSSSINLSLAIKNLFDKDYSSPAQGTAIVGGIPNRGREWSLGMEWEF
jgi:outer membrane receptor protein involved in Fe transport